MRPTILELAREKTRPAGVPSEPLTSTATVLKRLALRYRHLHLHHELALIDAELEAILALHAPMLRDLQGVGTDVASQLLVTMGDNPERVTTEAKFAALVGVAPIPASSGKTTRHRLGRAGDRQANKAIHHVVLVRMRHDSTTQAYVTRRRQEGKSTKEIMRCLKRYVAREIYEQLLHPQPAPDAGPLRTARTAKHLTLQQAADALHVWPTALSRLERRLSHDNDFHNRYETWLNAQSAQTARTPYLRVGPRLGLAPRTTVAGLARPRELPARPGRQRLRGQGRPRAVAQRSQQRPLRPEGPGPVTCTTRGHDWLMTAH